ncbi:MAG TPA: hypothetical protein VK009_19740, partial [Chloroflexota bacterium]|nr:hypothetical protein [Chloroflexota bacterium]
MNGAADPLGAAVLQAAVDEARGLWGERLLAAYALGSLAHGGFSRLVSDVDAGFVLQGPLTESDAARAVELGKRVTARGLELADRLSVFWGSRATLEGDESIGRFPAIDRTDLLLYG